MAGLLHNLQGGSSLWSIKFFVFASLCSFIGLQAVYQLSGPVCKSTWSYCASYFASHLHFTLCDWFLVHLKSYNFLRDRYP